MTTTTHAAIARRLLTEKPALIATASARQGDILLVRVGDAPEGGRATPAVGLLVGKGRHGEHRLGARRYARKGNLLSLPDGGRLVHTDEPHARHAAIELLPGDWRITRQREYHERAPRRAQD